MPMIISFMAVDSTSDVGIFEEQTGNGNDKKQNGGHVCGVWNV